MDSEEGSNAKIFRKSYSMTDECRMDLRGTKEVAESQLVEL
jgi:hypothetical protein